MGSPLNNLHRILQHIVFSHIINKSHKNRICISSSAIIIFKILTIYYRNDHLTNIKTNFHNLFYSPKMENSKQKPQIFTSVIPFPRLKTSLCNYKWSKYLDLRNLTRSLSHSAEEMDSHGHHVRSRYSVCSQSFSSTAYLDLFPR